jgi:hypothetical protein
MSDIGDYVNFWALMRTIPPNEDYTLMITVFEGGGGDSESASCSFMPPL